MFSYTNSKPSEFENVKVYAASNWFTPVSGSIKNLLIQNKNDGEYFQQKTVVLMENFPGKGIRNKQVSDTEFSINFTI